MKTDTNISFHPRYERAVSRSRSDIVTVVKLLSRGDWHIGVFNDDTNSRTIRTVIVKKRRGSSCPKSCNGHGTCENGKCVCHLQYSGIDCSQSKYCKIMYKLDRLYNAILMNIVGLHSSIKIVILFHIYKTMAKTWKIILAQGTFGSNLL